MKLTSILLLIFSFQLLSAQENDARTGLQKETDDLYYTAKDFARSGQYDLALSHFLDALEHCKVAYPDSSERLYKTHFRLATVYTRLTQYDQAVMHWDTALVLSIKLYGELNDETIWNYIDMGNTYSLKFDLAKSEELNQKALALTKELYGPESKLLSTILMHIGMDFYRMESYGEAELKLLKALEIAGKIYPPEDENMNRLYNNIGMIYRKKKELAKALNYAEQAIRIKLIHYAPDHPSVAKYYTNLGHIYRDMAKYGEAETNYMLATEITGKTLGYDHDNYGANVNNLGQLAFAKGDYHKAIKLFYKARQIQSKTLPEGHPYLLVSYRNVSLCHEKLGDYEAALAEISKTIPYFQNDEPESFILGHRYVLYKANYLKKIGRYKESRHLCDSLLTELIQKDKLNDISMTSSDKAVFYSRTYTDRAAIIASDESLELDTRMNLALQDIDSAMLSIQTGWEGYFTDDSRQYLQEESAITFDRGIEFAFEIGDYSKALMISETNKSNILRLAMQKREALAFGGVPQDLIAQLTQLNQEVINIEKSIISLKNEFPDSAQTMGRERLVAHENHLRIMQIIEAEYPDYFHLKYRSNDVKIEEIKDLAIRQNRAFISYHLIDDKGYVTYLSPSQINGFSFELDSSDIAWIESFQSENISNIINQENITSNHHIYKKIFEPAHQFLQQDNLIDVTIIPHGLVSYIAFEMLAIDEKENAPTRLIEEITISYAYSASLMNHQIEHDSKNIKMEYAGFAPVYDYENPSYELMAFREHLSPLFASQFEIEQAKTLFEGEIFLREKATASTFLENGPKAKIIHLAMHARSINDDPLQSGLYFYENEQNSQSGEQSKLTLFDIYNIQIPSDLVILSACKTGSGSIRGNEGPISLARGFQYAGAKSIVMNRWMANDEASSKIVTNFLKNIRAGERKDKALQLAKIEYLKSADPLTSHPYFWAGLTLYGNTDPIRLSTQLPWWFWLSIGVSVLTLSFFFFTRKKSTI